MKTAEPELAKPALVNQDLVEKAKRVISAQLFISILLTVFFLLKGPWEAISAFYGGFAGICITVLLLRRVRRASSLALGDPRKSMQVLYFGVAQRLLLVLALIALGIAVLKLYPTAVVCGFAIAQLGYLVGLKDRTKKISQHSAS